MNVVEEKRSSVVMWLMVSKDLGEKSSRRRTQKELSLPGLDGVPSLNSIFGDSFLIGDQIFWSSEIHPLDHSSVFASLNLFSLLFFPPSLSLGNVIPSFQ